ncbi:M48 family metallopeptidase [Crenobacter caeni]|uniref:M48 family metallopeptidase n=1 Tax=Crenobacter caeni TaxID=2705474 RepID=A0A6B2KUT7_9NEIS|nr:M48 family metallopeptidase [Crenobacter caeni]NDV14002.1 M48 family metallopeptidase [Crenobacter caeni]
MTASLTLLFIACALATLAARLVLGARQIAHVRAHRDTVPAAFAEAIPLDAHQKAADYTAARMRLALVGAIVDTGWLFVLTLGGGIAYAQRIASDLAGDGIAGGVLTIALAGAAGALVSLPLTLASTFGVEARFGFNRVTPGLFVADLVRHALVAAVLLLPLAALALWLMQAAGELWWLWAWGAWALFSLSMLVLYPLVIAPLFNRFTPLTDPALEARIGALLERAGFAARSVLVMDGSRRSGHGNAYFTGFGKARRIVFFDTLLSALEPDEIEAVLAHELGHYRLHHIRKRVVTTLVASLALFALLGFLARESLFYQALGVAASSATNATALLLFSLVLPVLLYWLTPLTSYLSRRHEYEADAFAARVSDGAALARALVKLYRDNASTLTPDPIYSAFYDSHPGASARLAHLQGCLR